jgi:hypothetical protein
MPRQQVKIFVGSAKETTEVNDCISRVFVPQNYIVHSWEISPVFQNLSSSFEALFKAARYYDFGLFVLGSDDEVVSRSIAQGAPRDNVIFELGLFLGALGPERVAAIREAGALKIPSDLNGVHIDSFNRSDPDILLSSIGSLLGRIRAKIDFAGPRPPFSFEAPFEYENGRLTVHVDPKVIDAHLQVIGKRKLLLVAHKVDPGVNHDEDENIHLSKLRSLSRNETAIIVGVDADFGELTNDEWIEGDLFLVPADVDVQSCRTVYDIKEAGGITIKRVQIA